MAENKGALLLRDRFPAIAEALQDVAPLPTKITRSGDLTVLIGGNHLHSAFDPVKEAARSLGSVDCAIPCVVVLGVGLGYILIELARRIPADARLIAIEKDPALLRTALENPKLEDALNFKGLELYLGEPPAGICATKPLVIETPATALDTDFYHRAALRLIAPPSRPLLRQRARIFVNLMNGLGDLILVAPTVRALHRAFDAEITALTWENGADLARSFPFIDQVIPWQVEHQTEEGFRAFLNMIAKTGPYDLSLDFAYPDRSSLIAQATGAALKLAIRPQQRFGNGIEVISRRPGHSVMRESFKILDRLGVPRPVVEHETELYFNGEDIAAARSILATIPEGKKLVVMHPGAGVASRRWAADKFAFLADRLVERYDAAVLFLGGRLKQMSIVAVNEGVNEEDIVTAIMKRAKRRHYSAAGRDNTKVMALLLDRADLFVGNNSGPAHLSGHIGGRTVTLWGPADPQEFSPIGPEVEVVMNITGLTCFPCGTTGCDKPVCMEQLTVEDALAAIERRWPGLPPRATKRSLQAVEIGAGGRPRPGYLHLDRRALPHIEAVADVTRLPLVNDKIRQVHTQHLIEHFPRSELKKVLGDWVKTLEPGGALMVITPNLGYIASEYLSGSMPAAEAVMRLFGEQDYPGNFHYTIFDRATLMALLRDAGCDPVYDCTRKYESRPHPMSLYVIGYRNKVSF